MQSNRKYFTEQQLRDFHNKVMKRLILKARKFQIEGDEDNKQLYLRRVKLNPKTNLYYWAF